MTRGSYRKEWSPVLLQVTFRRKLTLDPPALAAALEQHRVTHLTATPSLLTSLVAPLAARQGDRFS